MISPVLRYTMTEAGQRDLQPLYMESGRFCCPVKRSQNVHKKQG